MGDSGNLMYSFARRFLIALVLIAGSHPLLAQGEELEALKKAYAAADAALNAAWTKLKAELPASEFEELRDNQRAWLGYRGQYEPEGGTEATQREADFYQMATDLTKSRITWLRALTREASDSLTGTWEDSMGGNLRVMQKDSELYFTCEVVRGPTYHLGRIAGVGSWNWPLGWFSDKGRDASRTDVSNLAFVQRGNKLEVIGANTGYYCGARAYFDGMYVRTEDLSAGDQADVLKAGKSGELPEP